MGWFLFILVAFVGLTAFISGLILMVRPDGSGLGMRTSILKHTPFRNFFIPGALLFLLVGGINLLAVYFRLNYLPVSLWWAFAGGILLTGWILVQMMWIRPLQLLQGLYLMIGFLITLISFLLTGMAALYV